MALILPKFASVIELPGLMAAPFIWISSTLLPTYGVSPLTSDSFARPEALSIHNTLQ